MNKVKFRAQMMQVSDRVSVKEMEDSAKGLSGSPFMWVYSQFLS